MAYKIDFHVHTNYSYDSTIRPEALIAKARQVGLDAIVVLDHDSIEGGRRAAGLTSEDVRVIPAVEIYTDIGDIVGLFVTDEIRAREYHEVIEDIRRQGGIVMLPHPYHKHNLPDDICELIDLIEINNARAIPERNTKAAELAEKHNIPAVSGSDAHFLWEVGNSITIFEDTPKSHEELREIILKGKRTHRIKYSNPIGIVFSQLLKYWRQPGKIITRFKKLFGIKAKQR